MQHPFLDTQYHIQWPALTLSAIQPDITLALAQAEQALSAISQQPHTELTFASTFLALEKATGPLEEAWGKVAHLTTVADSPELRTAYAQLLPAVSSFITRIPLNQPLYQTLKAFATTAPSLTPLEQRLVNETLHYFESSGANLDPEAQAQLQSIDEQLSTLTQKYAENVLDSTNAWELVITNPDQLSGLPPFLRNQAEQDATLKGYSTPQKPAWRFTLQAPSYGPLLQYLDDRQLRQSAYQAASKVASEPPYDNTDLIWQILNLRHQKAKLLGQTNFADHVLERRMAKTGSQALQFIEDMHQQVLKAFHNEIEALEIFASKVQNTARTHLEPWDVAYWSEKQRQAEFSFSEEELRPYFPMPSVLQGLFSITEQLFDIRIRPNTEAPTWHPDVLFYDIFDTQGRLLGSFYTDWYPRPEKRGGAWMNHLSTHHPQTGAHLGLMCGNLTPPTPNAPSLLSHREVETIFHEFGHLLHCILSDIPIKSLHGTNVPWDFVELPSQILENWCWERESLDLFARHYQTHEPLPEALFQKMKAARNYQKALSTMRQLAFSKLDLALHIHFEQYHNQDLEPLIRSILKDYLMPLATQPLSHIRRFTHVFSQPVGYAAGYYSYKWSEVLDADAFTRFQAEGILNPQVGKAFKEHILSKGNSEDVTVLFERFMGRKPDSKALLKRSGLLAE